MNGPTALRHRTLYLILPVLLGLSLAVPRAAVPGVLLVEDTVHAPSLEGNLVGDSPDRNVKIILPPDYYGSAERYPVVYFLNSAFESNSKWISTSTGANAYHLDAIAETLYEQGAIRPLILVLPDASIGYQFNLYCNSPVLGNWEDFVTQDLIAYVDH